MWTKRRVCVCVREFILYNTLIAAQVAVPMLGGFLVNPNTLSTANATGDKIVTVA